MNRRDFLGTSVVGMASITAGGLNLNPQVRTDSLPAAIQALTPMTAGIVPITDDERRGRIAKAQRLMEEQKIDAIFMEGGTSSYYFVGMRWGQSERTFGVVIPAKGAIAYVCPGFEEDRARELIKPAFGDEVRVWQEDESPYAGDREDRDGSRRAIPPHRDRGASTVLHRRWNPPRLGHGGRRRNARHGRLPHLQVARRRSRSCSARTT